MKKRVLLNLAMCFCVFSSAHAEDQALPSVVTLDTAAVKNDGITITFAKSGTVLRTLPVISRIVPDTTRLVYIHPAGSGKVLDVLVQPGASVRKGQALLHYQDHSLHGARLQAIQMRAALTAAIASRNDAAAAVLRAKQLVGQTLSLAELRRRQDVLAQADATMRARQADVDTLGHRFHEEFNSASEQSSQKQQDEVSTLISPVDGMVQTLDTSVAADLTPATNVASVADLSDVWIVSDITPEQAACLQPGGRQTTETNGGAITSRIDTVDGMANPQTGLVRIISRVPNPKGTLVPGMVVDATLTERDSVTGIVVPAEAIQKIDGYNIVFAQMDQTHYRPVRVNVALDDGMHAVVSSGLKEGEAVVSHGSFALKSIIGLAGLDAD
ncbi:efflux transporter periplasmic adaptor subunit [Acetobacter pomorum]|uniref:Efflux transporter periplasmic adaptor subunit n=1 Tax=Acetobacter pomorum TaxID=65959 RepID=A0A2G4R9D9_9PROT|nr:efflux RND transporter periplasmic adaptor subunit [Acetobacter pomorum]PHY93117.1 efflux transporter periplasmic adaptor subunit [Acetobacter pomorum]GBR49401.1 heavy metal/cation efflux pump CzcB/HlyD [Acetobacter pomorum DSM 11825]